MVIENPLATVLTLPFRNASRRYMAGEFSLYLEGTDDVDAFCFYSKTWQRLAYKGKINSAYGARIMGERLTFAVQQLVQNVDTKNAVIMLRDDRDLAVDLKDRCCTLYIHFYIQHNKLNMRVCSRSNDLWLGVPYDVFCFARIMQYVLFKVNTLSGNHYELGEYVHQMLNVHVYEKHWEKVKKAAELSYNFDPRKAYLFPDYDERVAQQQDKYFDWESRWRKDSHDPVKKDALLTELRDTKFRPFWETLGSMIVNDTTNAEATTTDEYWFGEAKREATKSACIDRQVGCVLVSEDGLDMAVGHNEVCRCNQACDDKEHRECEVVHAEVQALKAAKHFHPAIAYVTLYPCLPCRRALESAGVKDIRVIGFSHKGAGGDTTVKLYDPEYEEV